MALNEVQTHHVITRDTYTPLELRLRRKFGASRRPENLTGQTVQVRITRDDRTVLTDWTATGVTVIDAEGGRVQYDFQSADVATAGTYWLFIRVGDGSEWTTYPPDGRKFRLVVTDPD